MSIVNYKRGEDTREVVVRIPEELYHRLENESRKRGFSSVSEYILHLLLTHVPPERDITSELLEKVRSRIERMVQDELNKRLTQLELLRRQLVEVYEKVNNLEQKISEVESRIRDMESVKVEVRPERKQRKTAIEILREEQVLFESTLPPRVDRDRLFASLERSGAVVIKLRRERVAISPEFWEFFKKKLDEIHTSDEREIQSIMGEKGFKLWKALYSDNLVIYDSKLRKWRPVHGELP
ncbi:MAG: CopG family transcriptional regulator [Desulfurococcaceae archaeon]